jgi:hypothetical protein
MALHDFSCRLCGHVARDVNVPITIGAAQARVLCTYCKLRMDWIPQVGRMDAGSGPGFQEFDTFDGLNRKVHVTSLKQVRDIERASEVAHRNGEGQPLVFRAFSNDPTNRDKSALHPNWAGEQPTEAAKRRFGSTKQTAASEPDASYGPGVTDANATALPD